MPTVTVQCSPNCGPVIHLGIAVASPRAVALQMAGRPIPTPAMVLGLIDTGASSTAIDPSVVQHLNLQPTGTTNILTPSTGTGTHACSQFDVAIGIVMDGGQMHFIATLPVIESHLNKQGIQALIGRDIIDQGILIYNGYKDLVTLAF